MNYEQARFNMIEQQIRPWEVLDNHVLSLLMLVKREDFVPAEHQSLSFVDMEIPLTADIAAHPSQCMLAPRVEARLLQDLALGRHERVLEVGTGSGHMAALMAHTSQHVLSLEIDADLAAQARINLQAAGIYNAEVLHADGAGNLDAALASNAHSEFDAIVLSGSVAEVPPALLTRLKVGGRLSAIVGFAPMMRATLVTRVAADAWRTTQAWDTVAPRLLNFPEPSRFNF